MKTIEDAKKAKQALELQIAQLLHEYYKDYGCVVDAVSITQHKGIAQDTIYNIDLDVRL